MSDGYVVRDHQIVGPRWQTPVGTAVRVYLVSGTELSGTVSKVEQHFIDLGSAVDGGDVVRIAVTAIAAVKGVDPDYKRPSRGAVPVQDAY